jgi:ubiquitin carboxyl-terminal hydrolase 10
MEGATRREIAQCTEPDSEEKLSTVSTTVPTLTLARVPAFTPPFLNRSLAFCDTGAAPAPNPLLSASSVIGFSTPTFPPPSHVQPSSFPLSRIPLSCVTSLPNSEFLGLLSSTTPSHLTGSPTLPRIRARGLVNTENVCFVNAALQILVHFPLLWNLFKELGDLKEQRREGGPETGGGATPLMDATARLFEEFMLKEKEPPQEAAEGKPREGEEAKKKHDVIDSFEQSTCMKQ